MKMEMQLISLYKIYKHVSNNIYLYNLYNLYIILYIYL